MTLVVDWGLYPNFSKREFDCKETGENHMQASFMERLQRLRTAYGKPMRITSGYRSPKHSVEAKKVRPGAHASGHACDVAVRGSDALHLIRLALELGFTGIGVQQKGASRFIHLDDHPDTAHVPRPALWSY